MNYLGNNMRPVTDSKNKILEEVNVKEILHKYFWSQRYIYLLVSSIALIAAYYYLKTQQPAYRINAKILIHEEKDPSGGTEDMLRRTLKLSSSSQNVSNEVQILSSYPLMNDVLKSLNLNVKYFWQDYLKTRENYTTFPVVVDSFKLSNSSVHHLAFEILPIDNCEFVMKTEDWEETCPFNELFTNSYGTFRFVPNDPDLNHEGPSMLVQFPDMEYMTEALLGKLKVVPPKDNSTMVQLSFVDVIPERGINILNKLIELYNVTTISDKNKIARETVNFLDDRLVAVDRDLKNIEQRIVSYKLKNNIAAQTIDNLDLVFETTSNLTGDQKELEVQLSILASLKESLEKDQSNETFELIPANLASFSSSLVELIGPYNTDALQRKAMLQSAKASNPIVKGITQKLRDYRRSINTTIINIRSDLNFKLEAVKSQIAGGKSQLRAMPTKQRGLDEIERQQKIIEELYVYLLQKKEEASLSLIATSSNAKVVDYPRSSRGSISPKKKLTYLSGLLSGLFLPFIFFLGRDIINTNIESEDELKELIKDYEIIGTINKVKGSSPVVATKEHLVSAEKFRSLRTNLLLEKTSKMDRLMVTSSISGEGKSFVALNLAISFANANKKVLLIDMDLRKPKIADYLGIHVDIGVSNYLMSASSIKESIHAVGHVKNLFVMPSGPTPPKPSEILESSKLRNLFDSIPAYFDQVIIDTPPAGIIADAVLLNEFMAKTIYVTRSNITKRPMIKQAIQMMDQGKLTNSSFVFNGATVSQMYGYKYSNKYFNYTN